MNDNPAVIIPFYKEQLDQFEEISVQQCFKILSNFKIIAIKPQSLSLDKYHFKFDEVVSFEDHYFSSVPGYNELMLSPVFYKKFLDHSFILIYQPDAFVFRDDLLYWCNSGFDYIGAPWLTTYPYPDFIKKIKNRVINYFHYKWNVKTPGTDLPSKHQFENRVGNGGFSLRNTKKFYDICSEENDLISYYNSRPEFQFGEDVFWSLEANRSRKRMNIPNYKTAVHFSIEISREHAFQITNGKLPFGCHAWDRNLDFWKPILKNQNVTL
jgi:hypothetical protein